MTSLVTRLPIRLTPDSSRVITRLFSPGDLKRTRAIIERILAFPVTDIEARLEEVEQTFGAFHPELRQVFEQHFDEVRSAVPAEQSLSPAQRLLIGACFTMEYALESVAVFNPSMVPAMIQEGVPAGGIRFLMSLRDRRRAPLIDRLPHGNHRCVRRRSD